MLSAAAAHASSSANAAMSAAIPAGRLEGWESAALSPRVEAITNQTAEMKSIAWLTSDH